METIFLVIRCYERMNNGCRHRRPRKAWKSEKERERRAANRSKFWWDEIVGELAESHSSCHSRSRCLLATYWDLSGELVLCCTLVKIKT